MSTAMTPVVTFGVFSVLAKIRNTQSLNTEIVFTSLTLFELLASPVSVLIETLGGVMSAVGSFQRIGEYLATETRVDRRQTTSDEEEKIYKLSLNSQPEDSGIDISTKREAFQNCMTVQNYSVSWDSEKPPILSGLNFEIKRSQVTMIIGPVGCGKSTLLKALLGETPRAPGLIKKAFHDAAYCNQTPWLTNGTVQQNILGVSEMDEAWYDTVIHACALDADLEQFNGGDKSMVGSKGITLSGGQQMRLVCFLGPCGDK
jgi:ABC-type bacteriocin/lantibiotic exporter with double-glycine peptidase domain